MKCLESERRNRGRLELLGETFMSIARAGAWALLFACGVLSRIGGADELAGGNLLVNGDAEAHRCTADWTAETPVPGWRVIRGAASVLCYDAFGWTGESP